MILFPGKGWKNLMTTEINKLYISSNRHYVLNEVKAVEIDLNGDTAHSLLVSQVAENSTVLDVGCSYGYLGEWLITNKGCTVYGIDVDRVALDKVRNDGLYKDVFEIDLDYPEKNPVEFERFNKLDIEFDYIICGDVLEHLKNPTAILTILSERLKEGGKILVSIPNISNIDIILNLIEGRFNYSETGILDSTHLRFFTKTSFIDWIDSINYHVLKDYSLDVALIGSTRQESGFASNIKNNYPTTYTVLTNAIGEEADTLQYIFVLTKKRQQAKGNINNKSSGSDLKRIKLIDKYLEKLRDLEKKLIEKDKILQKLLSKYSIVPINLKTRPSVIKDRISVIIPVKNGGEQLRGLLRNIRSQRKVENVEIIVIDSESTDNSVQIAKEFGAKIIQIPQKEFNHGATRNLGAKEANGNYLVFTVQDAMPINNYWLYNMICPFLEYPELAALSSKQFVKPEADLFTLWMSEGMTEFLGFKNDSIYSLSDGFERIDWRFFDSTTKRRLTFFDNVSSCMRRDTFKDIQFSPLINAEDMDFGVRIIENGRVLGYLTSTGVYHWHERGADYVFKRHYIGTKANVHVLKNDLQFFFDRNNISWECLAANIAALISLINTSIAELGDIDPEPVKAIKSFINALQENVDTLPDRIEKTSKGEKIYEDSGLELLLREVVGGDTALMLRQKYNFDQNFLISDFMKHFEDFTTYLCSKHHTLKGREKDFILCLYKIFAMTAGEALGAYYLEAETLNRLTSDLKRIDYLLGKGVCYF